MNYCVTFPQTYQTLTCPVCGLFFFAQDYSQDTYCPDCINELTLYQANKSRLAEQSRAYREANKSRLAEQK